MKNKGTETNLSLVREAEELGFDAGHASGAENDSDVARATFELPREVRLNDTDASGMVEFASYIRMMEETEYAFLRSRGLRVVLYDQRGTMGFPRLATEATVLQPLRFGDRVVVRLELIQVDGKQVTYRFTIMLQGAVAVRGEFRVAFCRFPNHRPPYAILIPEEIVTALTADPQSFDPLTSLADSRSKISLTPLFP